ncbi:S-adenosyl-L-methionine-dependent methyltransferase, partial [Bimuria novae-zelandiae CBS 107.79]
MRFLEIGAGTGSTTAIVLSVLHNQNVGGRLQEYVYIDTSPSFFEKARQRFATYSKMRYQAFNAEDDPAAQGFDEHSFDVVIADQVLHATSNLDNTLTNIRKLFKPGGQLV